MAIIAHYALGLPADCDIRLIRARAKGRGVLWDVVPELHFTGFLLRESGQRGATANSYAAAAGIDTLSWKFTRILLATNGPAGADRGVAHEIRLLARLLPDTLPQDGTR